MAIQYSGNAQQSTFTAATKQDIINGVETALLAAGWTTISGHGSTNLLMQSATTPQGFAMNVRLKDNGGTCVTFSIESTDGVLVGGNSTTAGGGFLNPGTGYNWAVTCCKYEAWIYATPYPTVNRTFVAFGVPYVDPSVVGLISRIGWMQGNSGSSDTDSTLKNSFRTQLFPNTNNSYPSMEAMLNSNIWNFNTGGSATGAIGICTLQANGNNAGNNVTFEDGDGIIIDALIGWGSISSASIATLKGQPWDCFVSTASYASDQSTALDGHNWTTITSNNVVTYAVGTLFKATS